MSYHDAIQKTAREVETERSNTYSREGKTSLTEDEMEYIYGAIYKLLRMKNQTMSYEKALDDLIDAYNYCAMLYDSLSKQKEQA